MFIIIIKHPELSNDTSFQVVRILCTWNKCFSVLYATIADVRSLYIGMKNMNKINSILNTLSTKWEPLNSGN